MTSFRLRILAQTLPFLLIAPSLALAQHPPTRGEATAALNQPAKPGAQQYTRQQIDQLVAPIALYPDQVLSQVLMAATYPDQIVQAAQWTQQGDHGVFKDDALVAALEPMPWDPSVKALCAFPQLVQMMAEHIEWTEALGVAFATQQAEIMSRVQALRHLAMKSGRLAKVKHLKLQEEGETIVITETEPGRIFIPVYNSTVVYGEWPDQGFPPVFIPPPQGFVSETIEPGLEVSIAYTVVEPLWGWSRVDWRGQRISVDRTAYSRITRSTEVGLGDTWQHRGPLLLVAPRAGSRTTTVTAEVPAGTVAPARAAAVTALPQRAAADPARIKTQTSSTETQTNQPGPAQTTTTRPEPNRATAQPGTVQPQKAQSGTSQPGKAQSGASPAEPSKFGTRGREPNAGQPVPDRAEQNAVRPNERQMQHPESVGSSQERRERMTAPNPADGFREKETAQPNAAAGPGQPQSAREREHAKIPAGSPQQMAVPEREGGGMPGPEQQPNARDRERNGAAATPGQHETPARPPEHAGGQPSPGAQGQANRPQHPGPEAGQGSSTPPAAATPHAQPPAQKPGEHPGQPGKQDQNGQKDQKER